MLDGLYQSLICFFMAYLLFSPATFNTESGQGVNDGKRMGVYIANATVIVVNLFILLNTYRWDWLMLSITLFSILLVFAWTGIYTSFTTSFQFYEAGSEVYGQLTFWAQTLLTIVIALLPRFASKAYQKIYLPRDIDIIREQVRQGKFKYLENVDPERINVQKVVNDSSSSDASPPRPQYGHERSESTMSDEMPIYPPSMAPTATTAATRNPHSQQGSDDSTAPPVTSRLSTDRPRMSLDRPRPSFDRARASMDRTRPSFEASRDFTSAAYLSRVESSQSGLRNQTTH